MYLSEINPILLKSKLLEAFILKHDFFEGLKSGIAIALGYFAVSFSFGILAVSSGLSVIQATLISMTNLTSAGQFAGLTVITSGGNFIEMAVTQLIINLRYALMGFSLSQKLDKNVGILKRCAMAFSNTDEIFAASISRKKLVTLPYFAGLSLLPWLGWSFGTVFGAVAGGILPQILCDTLGIALYGMLIAVVMPAFREKRSVKIAVIISIALSIVCTYLIKGLSSGFAIVICTVAASTIAALLFPIERETEEQG